MPPFERVLSVATIAGVLMACSARPTPVPGTDGQASHRAVIQSPHRSWMRPDSTSQDLLYVQQSETTMDVFAFPSGELEGQLTGLDEPLNECIDAKGDIFIPNYRLEKVLEYRHGGTKPIATFEDPTYYPSGCAIDPVNGELAVTEALDESNDPGEVVFYKMGRSRPHKRLSDVKIPTMEDCAYDGNGNLYLFGLDGSTHSYGMLRRGKHFIIALHLSPGISVPGQMQWDGSHLVVSNRGGGALVEYTISGHSGTKAGVTTLKGNSQVDYFWIQGSDVVAPEFRKTEVGIWNYPAGGRPTGEIATTYYPGSVVISPAGTLP